MVSFRLFYLNNDETCFESTQRASVSSNKPFRGCNLSTKLYKFKPYASSRVYEMTENFYIWSHKHSAWWRKGSWGYTNNLEEAETYKRADAEYVCNCENKYNKPLMVEMVPENDKGKISLLTNKNSDKTQ